MWNIWCRYRIKCKNFILVANHRTDVMSQIFISHSNFNLKIMWRNYTNCKGRLALTMLLWRFTFLPDTSCLVHEKQSFYLCFWPAWTRGLKLFQHSKCCFTQHCWQGGMFFHKTSGCIFPIRNIFQNNAKLLVQHPHTGMCSNHLNSTTNKIPAPWLSLQTQ